MPLELKNHNERYESGRINPGAASATQLARDYLREKLYRNSKQGFVDMKPYPSQIIPVGSKRRLSKTHKSPLRGGVWPGVIQAEKEAEKEAVRRRRYEQKHRPSDLALPSSNAIFQRTSGNDPGVPWEPPVPKLGRVGSFEGRYETERSYPRRSSLYPNEFEPSVMDMRQKRAAMESGELERVIPPSKSVLEALKASARPAPITWATLSGPVATSFPNPAEISPPYPSSPSSPQHKRKHTSTPPPGSSASRLEVPHGSTLSERAKSVDIFQSGHRPSALSSLAHSADLLDSTRRTITSAIRRSAERTVHSFSYRGSNDATYPSDDDESFYCIGEPRPPAFHHTETDPSPAFSFISSIHSSDFSPESSEDAGGHKLIPENKGVWVDAEAECRLCKRKYAGEQSGICSNCEDEFKRPVTRYVDSPFDIYDDIEPIAPLRIVKVAAKNRGFEINTNQLPLPNSVAKSTESVSIFDQDPGPPPMIPLPKIPTKDAKVQTGESSAELRVRSAEHHVEVDDSPGYPSQEAVVQSVLQTAISLRTRNRLLRRTKLESMPREQDDAWQPVDLRVAYNNSDETMPNKIPREEVIKEALPMTGGSEDPLGRERRESLTRGSENRRRPNSRGEGIKPTEGLVRRDTSFYSFYDEILENAKERPARRRDGGRG
ncbi:hypothetical protein V497_07153 [Pseudogymnoascus sp. VKM F-4516 (FW-969)]|nr:hypothetical protein V497_07153 [Pseudogymnoascus sp. VKM F-4516 (FW-969)]